MNELQVFLFGKFIMRYGEQVLTGLKARRVQELFCYLLLNRDRPHSREFLADLLWGDTPTNQSKSYLRKALWQLQATVDPLTEPGNSTVLLVELDWVQLNPQSGVWIDVMVFEEAFTAVQGVPGRELIYDDARTLQNAVDLYQGELIEGCYLDWCLYERERLKHLYLTILDKLMSYCEAHREFEKGISYGMRTLRYDCARECTHRRLMRLQYLAGYRTAALRQYVRCVSALDEELGVRPAKRTVALCEQIRADRFDGPIPAPAGVRQAVIPQLPEVLSRLQQFQVVLDNTQCQIQQDIQAVKRAMYG